MLDERPDPENLTKLDRAMVRSSLTRSFLGRELRPFAGRSQLMAQSLGLRLFSLADSERAAIKTGALYDGMFLDAATVVWSCWATPNEVTKATLNRETAMSMVLDWAEQNNVSVGNAVWTEMVALFGELLEDVFASSSNAESSDGGSGLGEPKTPGPPS